MSRWSRKRTTDALSLPPLPVRFDCVPAAQPHGFCLSPGPVLQKEKGTQIDNYSHTRTRTHAG